jgi:hypothetical protein
MLSDTFESVYHQEVTSRFLEVGGVQWIYLKSDPRLSLAPFFLWIAARTFWTERANLAKPVILEPSHWLQADLEALTLKSGSRFVGL